MNIHFDLLIFMHLLAAVLGVLVALVLWNSSRSRQLAFNAWLGGSIFSLAIGLGLGFMLLSGLADGFPHLYRVGNLFALMYMPLSYLYMRTVTTQQSPKWRDLLHFLPALFYVVDYMPFFLLSTEAKQLILQSDFADVNNAFSFDEGWITTPYTQLYIRTLQFFLYWVLQIVLLRKVYRMDTTNLEPQAKSWLTWAAVNTGIQTLLFLPNFFVWVFSEWGYIYLTANVYASISLVFSALALFFRPDILYGKKGLIIHKTDIPNASDENIPVISRSTQQPNGVYLEAENIVVLQSKLDALMLEKAPFRRHGYASVDLAIDLGIPPYQLSAFLNQSLGTNFSDYINELRIRYCIERLENGQWKELTMEGIGYECGFSNRNTFTMSFKKFTGETPSNYLRSGSPA